MTWKRTQNIFDDADDLHCVLKEYLDECENNPIKIQHPFNASGTVIYGETFKPKVPTVKGFLAWAKLGEGTYYKYKKIYPEVIEWFENTVFNIKYTNAAAGVLSPNLIIRDLGLADSVKNEVTVKDIRELTDEQLAIIAAGGSV